jgi:hypothetical protein
VKNEREKKKDNLISGEKVWLIRIASARLYGTKLERKKKGSFYSFILFGFFLHGEQVSTSFPDVHITHPFCHHLYAFPFSRV